MSKKLGIVLLSLALVAVLYPLAVQQYLWERVNRYEEARITLRPRLDEKAQYQWFLYREVGWNYKDFKTISRLIDCESNWKADAVSHTEDRGLLQIHLPAHQKRAVSMGLDVVNSWEDNLRYGVLLYREQGVAPWVCSLLK